MSNLLTVAVDAIDSGEITLSVAVQLTTKRDGLRAEWFDDKKIMDMAVLLFFVDPEECFRRLEMARAGIYNPYEKTAVHQAIERARLHLLQAYSSARSNRPWAISSASIAVRKAMQYIDVSDLKARAAKAACAQVRLSRAGLWTENTGHGIEIVRGDGPPSISEMVAAAKRMKD